LTIQIKKPTIDYLSLLFNNIIEKENLTIDDESKEFILQISNYSYKVLINYCEKIKLLNMKITKNNVLQITTNIHFYKFEELDTLLKNKKIYDAMNLCLKIIEDGYSVIDFLDNYYLFVKITKLIEEEQKYEIIKLICKYIMIFYNIHEEEVEIILFIKNIYNIYDKKY
jgi:DNA polymerase III gamma/tau subunit